MGSFSPSPGAFLPAGAAGVRSAVFFVGLLTLEGALVGAWMLAERTGVGTLVLFAVAEDEEAPMPSFVAAAALRREAIDDFGVANTDVSPLLECVAETDRDDGAEEADLEEAVDALRACVLPGAGEGMNLRRGGCVVVDAPLAAAAARRGACAGAPIADALRKGATGVRSGDRDDASEGIVKRSCVSCILMGR